MKTKSPTQIDFAILGLLSQESQSGYRIRKAFETTALGNYSSSPGSIYPALKRLENQGFIKSIEVEVNRKTKNQFAISKQGKTSLKDWIIQPLTKDYITKRLNELLLKFAFMDGMVSNEERMIFLNSFKKGLIDYVDELTAFHQKEASNMPLHGGLAVEHGIEIYKATLKWVKHAIQVISEQKKS